jgi:hypothetical protein
VNAASLRSIFLVACVIFLAACSPTPPTEADARAALERNMRAHFPKAPIIHVTRFNKTNGQPMSAAGVALYQMFYSATIEFPQGFVPERGDFWGEFMGGAEIMSTLTMLSSSGIRVVKGRKPNEIQILETDSAITFQHTERGWIVIQ